MKTLTIFTTKNDPSLGLFYNKKIQDEWEVSHFFYDELTVEQIPLLPLGTFTYLRDPFNSPFDTHTLEPLLQVILQRQDTQFIDNLSALADIYLEDKWFQYEIFHEYMPDTQRASDTSDSDGPKIYKKRISSRARDIHFTRPEENLADYIVQERIPIVEEYRVIEVCKEILPVMAIKRSKSENTTVKIMESTLVTPDVRTFIESLQDKHHFDLVGYDIARTADHTLFLIEINRSPQVTTFTRESEIHPFEFLLAKI